MDIPTLKVCIFDVNGVLIDSNLANARAMGAAFAVDGSLREHIESLYLRLTGIDRGEKIRIIQEQAIGKPFVEGEFELRWENFRRLAHRSMTTAPLTPGALRVLAELGKRRITRAALSNTPLPELQEILRAHCLDTLLEIVRGGGDWPKTESLMRLLEEFQFKPEQCLFFGDGKGDLAAALHAGVQFVAIDHHTGEFNSMARLCGPYEDLEDWARSFLGPP